MNQANHSMVIFYVQDQQKAKAFYSSLFSVKPRMDELGMTEFEILPGMHLGLMPAVGIERLLGPQVHVVPHASGALRCELYLRVDDPDWYYEKAIVLGACSVSDGAQRNWGEYVAYCADPDGHVLAFAAKTAPHVPS